MDWADGAAAIQDVGDACCMGASQGCHVRIIGHSKGGGLAVIAL